MAARSHARTEPMPRQDEKSFHRQVVELARYMGFIVWHDQATNAPRRCPDCGSMRRGPRNASGLPDLLLVRGERLIWAELKAQDGVTSTEQREWIARLRAAGETVYVWRPNDWPVIEKVLAR